MQNYMNKGNPVNVDFRTFILPPIPQSAQEIIEQEQKQAQHMREMKAQSSEFQNGRLESDFLQTDKSQKKMGKVNTLAHYISLFDDIYC